jgi:hypothetical protein
MSTQTSRNRKGEQMSGVDEKTLRARRAVIGEHIKIRNVGTEKESLYIRLDDLIMLLLKVPEFRFSASAFEGMLQAEIEKKILNKGMVTKEIFDSLCDYIWDLAVYCTYKWSENESKTNELLEERARRKRENRARK